MLQLPPTSQCSPTLRADLQRAADVRLVVFYLLDGDDRRDEDAAARGSGDDVGLRSGDDLAHAS